MKNRVFGKIKLLILSVVFTMLFCVSVDAFSASLKGVKVVESNIGATDPNISANVITDNVTLSKKDDYVIYEVTLKNNNNVKYTINNIEDNNTNKNLEISYTIDNKEVIENGEFKFKLKLLYKNTLENIEQINLKDLKITINLINEEGNSSKIIINNPTTGDSVLKYLFLLIIALAGLIIKQKKKKFGLLVLILPILFLPFIIFANETYKQDIIFRNITIKGEFLPYNVTIKVPGEEPIIKTITFGDPIGELPEVSKEGYTFDGWKDEDGNTVDEHTVVTGDIEITPKLTAIKYNITYELEGGTATNPTKYTIEDKITLNNPSKQGYSFSGWTGSNGSSLQTQVTINKGTTGDLNYVAHYSKSDNTTYKVIHRKQKLTLDGYDIADTDNLTGTTDSTVRPETKNYTGFIAPDKQDLVITADGQASLTYDYNRIIYTVDLDNLEDMTSNLPSGDYPYGTEVILTPDEKPGYTFDEWSDGNKDNPRTIIIDGPIDIRPTYTANTNTPYTVVHKFQNVDQSTYTDEIENLTGTTGTSVTPGVRTRTGFITPNTQTVTINGDGSTRVNYIYNRETFTFTLEDSDDVISSLPSGTYPYGTEITLTAKDKVGFDFDGWSDGNTDNPRTITIGDNITISPVYIPNSGTIYTVYHNKQKLTLDGYELANTDILSGETGSEVTPAVKTYTGFTSPNTQTVTINADGSTIVNYNYDRISYSFTIDGGEDVISSLPSGTYPYGTEVDLTAKDKDGYTFTEWSDGNTDNPRTLVVGDDTTISPVYTANTYTVVFNANLGTGSMNNQNFTYNVAQNLSKNLFTRAGYTFSKWNTKADGLGTNYNDEAEVQNLATSGTVNLYAMWTPNTNTGYTVKHYKQKITLDGYDLADTDDLTGTTGSQVTPSVNTYTGFTSPIPQEVVIKGDGTTEVTYNYNRLSYTYQIQDSEDVISSLPEGTYPYGTEITLTAKTKDGYTFSEWNDGNTDNPRTLVIGGNTTIKPIYEPNEYFVIFNANGGTGSMDNQDFTYGIKQNLSANLFSRTGYTFSNWNTEYDGSGRTFADEAEVENIVTSGGINLYAIWEPNELVFIGDDTISKIYSNNAQIVIINGASNGTGSYTYTEISEKNQDNQDTNYLSINGTEITITGSTPDGTYTYVVEAEDDNTGKKKNASFVITITTQQLDKVTNLQISQRGIVSFDNAANADGYLISIDGINYTPILPDAGTTTSYNYYDTIVANNGQRTVYVKSTNSSGYAPSEPETASIMVYKVDFSVNDPDYGTVDKASMNFIENETYSASNNIINFSPSLKSVTTLKNDTQGYTTTFDNWSPVSGTVTQDLSIVANYTRTPNSYTLLADPNGGTLLNTTGWVISNNKASKSVNYGSTLGNLPGSNNVYKTGSVLAGWNTAQDGTGTNITSSSTYNYTENKTIYAQWIAAKAMFDTGRNVNNKMKALAGNSLNNITSFAKATTRPDLSQMTSNNIVSINDTTYLAPIYMWFDNGTIYWWSEDNNPELNINASYMFSGLSNATSIDLTGIKSTYTNNFSGTFSLNDNLTSLDLSGLDTTAATDMSMMFASCHSLTSLNLGNNFNTSNVTNMYGMFYELKSITTIDLGDNFNTTNVTNTAGMFSWCINLTTIYATDAFVTTNISSSSAMFDYSNNLVGGLGSKCSSLNNDKRYAHIDGGSSNKGYFTNKSAIGIDFEANSNSATGSITTMTAAYNVPTPLSQNQFSLSGSVFGGWNTRANGSGTSYGDGDNITVTVYTKLYAQWLIPGATFDTGVNVNDKIKTLTNNDLSVITAISKSSSQPNLSQMTDDNIVSLPKSEKKIYMWLDNTTLKWWSEVNKPYLNDLSTHLLRGLKNLTSFDLTMFDTSKVTSAYGMFFGCEKLTTINGINNFNASGNITRVEWMFYNCKSLTSLDLHSWDMSNVTDLSSMFYGCSGLTTLDLHNWNTDNVTYLSSTFYNCSELTSINLLGWDVDLVKSFSNLFYDCKKLTSLDLSDWVTSSSTRFDSMFKNCESLTMLKINRFDVSAATTINSMFENCCLLTSIDLSSWQTSNVTDMGYVFRDCRKLTTIDVSGWDTSNVTNMYAMFDECHKLTTINVSSWLTPNVTTMAYMFSGCGDVTVLDVGHFNTSKVTNMEKMFSGCSEITTLNLHDWDTSNVTDMNWMFSACNALTTLDVSRFVTNKVTNMNNMFGGCFELTTLNVSNFNTSLVTDMAGMFSGCKKLTSLNLTGFDTSKVTDMAGMFYDCEKLTTLDLSSFNTSLVTKMYNMFRESIRLTTIYVSNSFVTTAVTDSDGMFYNCTSIRGGNNTAYNSSYLDKTYARIDRSGTPGYFTYRAAPSASIVKFINRFNNFNSKINKIILPISIFIIMVLGSVIAILKLKEKKEN